MYSSRSLPQGWTLRTANIWIHLTNHINYFLSLISQIDKTVLCYLQIPDIDILTLAFSSPNELMAVSGGGVHNYEWNFGLVITDQYTMLATKMSKLYSIEFYESSHHFVMYGVLVPLVSIQHLISAYNIDIPTGKQVKIFCDNSSMVNKFIFVGSSNELSINIAMPMWILSFYSYTKYFK
jgi:hypothetical protein